MHMEAVFRKSIHGGVVKQDINIKASEEGFVEDINDLQVGKERKSVHNEDDNSKSSQQNDLTGDKEDDQRQSRYGRSNGRIFMKDYRNLQMQFHEVAQRDAEKNNNVKHDEAELVSLCLGRTSSDTKKELILSKKENDDKEEDNLTLALYWIASFNRLRNFHHQISVQRIVNENEKGADQTWPPHKVLKTMSSGGKWVGWVKCGRVENG